MNLPRMRGRRSARGHAGRHLVFECVQPRQAVWGRRRRNPCPSQALHPGPTPATCSPCTASFGTPSAPPPRGSGGIRPGDAEPAALIANYYENILSFFEAHHDGEEKLVFPLLRERCDGEAR